MPNDVDVSSLSYEVALAELEGLIARLERGDVDLDEAVACYQRGSTLVQRCATLLDRTEATVLQLVVGAGGVEEERPLSAAAEDQPVPSASARVGIERPQQRRTDAQRPLVPPPPGSPARARAVPEPPPPRTAQRPAAPRADPPAPAAAPQLFPGLEPAPRAGDREGDFDLDDIPF